MLDGCQRDDFEERHHQAWCHVPKSAPSRLDTVGSRGPDRPGTCLVPPSAARVPFQSGLAPRMDQLGYTSARLHAQDRLCRLEAALKLRIQRVSGPRVPGVAKTALQEQQG